MESGVTVPFIGRLKPQFNSLIDIAYIHYSMH
jgi:hypothetical protein